MANRGKITEHILFTLTRHTVNFSTESTSTEAQSFSNKQQAPSGSGKFVRMTNTKHGPRHRAQNPEDLLFEAKQSVYSISSFNEQFGLKLNIEHMNSELE